MHAVDPVEIHWHNLDPMLRAAYEGRCWARTLSVFMATLLGLGLGLSIFVGFVAGGLVAAHLAVPVAFATHWVLRRRFMRQAFAERSAW